MLLTKIKKVVYVFVCSLIAMSTMLFSGCGQILDTVMGVITADTTGVIKFYNLVVESQECLDDLADDIYTYWRNAIYNGAYDNDINKAVSAAFSDNTSNLKVIAENEPEIKTVYKEIRNSKYEEEIKDVMTAYTNYYELVVNVSGSFADFSANAQTLKKELGSSLKRLALEI